MVRSQEEILIAFALISLFSIIFVEANQDRVVFPSSFYAIVSQYDNTTDELQCKITSINFQNFVFFFFQIPKFTFFFYFRYFLFFFQKRAFEFGTMLVNKEEELIKK